MTTVTCSTSIPRAQRLVVIKTFCFPSRNLWLRKYPSDMHSNNVIAISYHTKGDHDSGLLLVPWLVQLSNPIWASLGEKFTVIIILCQKEKTRKKSAVERILRISISYSTHLWHKFTTFIASTRLCVWSWCLQILKGDHWSAWASSDEYVIVNKQRPKILPPFSYPKINAIIQRSLGLKLKCSNRYCLESI